MFGCLEHLDISLIGQKTGTRLDGCLAVIAWLNGGRLKHVDFDGRESGAVGPQLTSELALNYFAPFSPFCFTLGLGCSFSSFSWAAQFVGVIFCDRRDICRARA